MRQVSRTIRNLADLESFLASRDLAAAAVEARSILVQVFTAETDPAWLQDLVDTAAGLLPSAVIVGATTVGEVVDGRSLTGQTVVGLSLFASSIVRAVPLPCAPGCEREAGHRLGRDLEAETDELAGVLLLGTPLSIDASAFLGGLEAAGGCYPVFGGGAGDYAAMEQSAVFCGRNVMTEGVVAVVLSGKDLHIENRTYLGWRPLSKEMTITEATGMVVRTVDGAPAFDLYSRYLDIPDDKDFFLNVLEFPFLVDRGAGPMARVPIAVDGQGGLQFVADVVEGESFRIGYGDPNLIISDANAIHEQARTFSPQAIFLYTCGCRRFLMQEDVDLETYPFEAIAPTFGFYTYGEFFRSSAALQLLNSTMVMVSLREGGHPDIPAGPAAIERPGSEETDPYANKHTRIVSRLVHFASAVTRELEEANREITKLSMTDRLTGLDNRAKLDEVLADLIGLARRYRRIFSVVLLDIDHFKQVNDRYGHLVGDDVLVRLAAMLRGSVRDMDTIGRWGGEEFLLILPDTDIDGARRVAEKLREAVSREDLGAVGRRTCSFGVTAYCDGDTVTDLLHRADEALYQAKGAGRNRVQLKSAPPGIV